MRLRFAIRVAPAHSGHGPTMSSPHARAGVLSVTVVTTTLLLTACTAGPGASTGTTGAPAANISLAAPAPPASPPSSCTGTDANVALPSAPHGLFVADANTPEVTSLVSRNTVQLGIGRRGNREARRPSRLRPCPVPGAFDVPPDVLALHDPRIGPPPPGRVEATHEERDGVPPASLSALRGKNR